LPADAQFDLLTALVEAADNAVLYGRAAAGKPNVIDTKVIWTEEAVEIQLIDNGPGFRPNLDRWELPDLMSERGRGVFLMRALVDEVTYPPLESGTKCVLVKRFKPDDDAAAPEPASRRPDARDPSIPGIYRNLLLMSKETSAVSAGVR